MSKFNSYARKLDEQAKAAFKEYREAEAAYKAADKERSRYPQKAGWVTAEYAAKSARAQADFLEARQAFETARRKFRDSDIQFTGMRKELEAAIADAYTTDPAHLDANTMELLKSGIMTSRDYDKLMRQAMADSNPTMVRMIGRYANNAAKARADEYGMNDHEAQALRTTAYNSKSYTGDDRLEAFDTMVNVYHRCTKNPGLIDKWDSLLGETIEAF